MSGCTCAIDVDNDYSAAARAVMIRWIDNLMRVAWTAAGGSIICRFDVIYDTTHADDEYEN